MIIQQQSLMHNPFGLLGACLVHSRGIYAAWTAHKSKHNLAIVYSILKTDYGLSIKSRCPETATQMERDMNKNVNTSVFTNYQDYQRTKNDQD